MVIGIVLECLHCNREGFILQKIIPNASTYLQVGCCVCREVLRVPIPPTVHPTPLFYDDVQQKFYVSIWRDS